MGFNTMRNHTMNLQDAMLYAGSAEQASEWPKNYYWSSVWWRLHAKQSKDPITAINYSRAQMRLYHDIRFRKEHYLRKPKNISDFIWSHK